MDKKQAQVGENKMNEEVIYDLGVDFDSSLSFQDGDLKLISYDLNVVQGVVNRLKTNLDEMELFYDDYGSLLLDFLGWKSTDETLSFMKSEIENVIKKEQRILNYNVDVKYVQEGVVRIEMELQVSTDYTIETTFELTENGIEVLE